MLKLVTWLDYVAARKKGKYLWTDSSIYNPANVQSWEKK